jgi:multiple sugar transport system substrate-binding protein
VSGVRGLTWDHPRGYAPLAAAACACAGELAISWDTQPLEGFEATPIAELARSYDLIVLDHPHLGEAVADDCLVPVAEVLGAMPLAGIAAVGASSASYDYDGRAYALPLDAAAQVQVLQPSLLGDRPVPVGWAEVLALAAEHPLALSLAGPHALLTFFSICAGLGARPLAPTDEALVPAERGLEALELMRQLRARSVAALHAANPIELLEAMARERSAACCPLVFGYVTYATGGDGREALTFADAPGLGSTLGGTGIAITRRCPRDPALVAHLTWLLDPATQSGFFPRHQGQPAARAAWEDTVLDASAGGFYSATRHTLEAAWVRPRFPGYSAFQARASDLIRGGLAERVPAARLLDRLGALWRASLPTGAVL